ncbi:E3 ubiquitin-protein ligase TRIM21-like [Trachemys scripta elegans]|uniref:E3 ubiquitin-protein ligase TRIM21-like n=1 Tax=Trachemys scripta elegans TaxID=31138 RepID=UPI0015567FDC|nr:E3 ubiquitin-protein ligase TRIM21-like [Trachemys scripta elegans]
MELAEARRYAVDVTLDPDTAHPDLILSPDKKTVTYQDRHQDPPNNLERFDNYPIVLGFNKLTGGKHYWEVEVEGKTNWTLGVCWKFVRRTEPIYLSPKYGFWTVWLKDGKYEACNYPENVRLPVNIEPRRVGIFLDYEAGKVSFYNVTDRSHLFTFTDISGTLHPYFYTGYDERGGNAASLIICPVPAKLE